MDIAMPKLDLSVSKLERKRQLAELVAKRLIELGHTATVITDHKNENGHTDRVIVKSSLGLVHTTASVATDPNGSIPVSDFEDGGQNFLAGKAFVVYGWLDRSGRTFMQFVPTAQVLGRRSMLKADIIRLADQELSTVLPGCEVRR